MEHPENSAEYACLQVNAGVEQPSMVNPYLKQMRKKKAETVHSCRICRRHPQGQREHA
jgi:hypothetical protein